MNEVEVIESYPCRFCGAGKICRSPKLGGGGFACVGECYCQAFEPSTGPFGVPEKIAVRQHRRLVSVDTAQALSHQYLRVTKVTNAALKEMVVFGAMLAEIDKALTSQRFSRNGDGASLRSWLEANCPEIEYSTAMDYKRTMKNFMAYMKLKEDTPLLEMMNADPYEDEAKESLRQQILDSMTGLTKTQLRNLTDKRGRAGGALKGQVGVAEGRRALTVEEQAADAAAEMRELVGRLHAFVVESKKVALLTDTEVDEFVGALKRIAAAAEAAEVEG